MFKEILQGFPKYYFDTGFPQAIVLSALQLFCEVPKICKSWITAFFVLFCFFFVFLINLVVIGVILLCVLLLWGEVMDV